MSQQTSELPRISVVVPSYNQAAYLEDCLLSIVGQGYPDLEILVMDGGSTDNSRGIIERFADQLSYWRSEKDEGQSAAINEGFQRSTGQILCWLNSDDLFLPGALLNVGRILAPRAGRKALLYGACVNLHDRGGAPWTYCETSAPFDRVRLTYTDYITQPSSFWTRELWLATGELDSRLHYMLDWDWFIRASQQAEFDYSTRPYSIYRYHAAHKSGQGSTKRLEEVLNTVEKYAEPYWTGVYRDVARSFSRARWLGRLLARLRVPQRQRLLILFFPRSWLKVRRWQDFGIAVAMCS